MIGVPSLYASMPAVSLCSFVGFQRTDWNWRSSWPGYGLDLYLQQSLHQTTASLVKGLSAPIAAFLRKATR